MIVRTPYKAAGGITNGERRAMDAIADRWIGIAMRTDPIDLDKIVPAIEAIYDAAKLDRPRVVVVPSPRTMAFAYGASAAIWHARAATYFATDAATDGATRAATDGATRDATYGATRAATRDATDGATYAATYAATYFATDAATYAATDDATYAATYAATRAATDAATDDATRAATDAATDGATRDATDAATDGATRAATRAATYDATRAATRAATYAATYAATDGATRDATYGATRAATRDATRDATYAATRAATYAATYAATRAATYAATYAATDAATDGATRAATRDATYLATDAATRAATDGATRDATDAATRAATDDATYADPSARACADMVGNFGLQCAANWWRSYQGGNMWAPFCAFLAAARDVLGLELPVFRPWEDAAIHGGFRVMHEKFCIVSDFPESLCVDEQSRPHCEDGPSHRWRDGWALYHWHGVRVPDHWIPQRDTLDPAEVLGHANVEVRAAGAAIIGWPRIMSALQARVIDHDPDPSHGDLIEMTLPGLSEPGRFLRAECPRNGTIVEGVPRTNEIDGSPINTVLAAQAWRWEETVATFVYPELRT